MAFKCFKCGCANYQVLNSNNGSSDNSFEFEFYTYFVFSCGNTLKKERSTNRFSPHSHCMVDTMNKIKALTYRDERMRKKFGYGYRSIG